MDFDNHSEILLENEVEFIDDEERIVTEDSPTGGGIVSDFSRKYNNKDN